MGSIKVGVSIILVVLLYVAVLVLVRESQVSALDIVQSGATNNYVDLSSSTVGVQIFPSLVNAGKIGLPAAAVTSVCVVYVDVGTSCATALTSADSAEPCLPAGSGQIFVVREEGWSGQVCGILKTGTGPVRVSRNWW